MGESSDHDGGYAEQVAVPARNVVALKPNAKTAATLAVSYLTAWNMLKANGAGTGKSLLVYGAGKRSRDGDHPARKGAGRLRHNRDCGLAGTR